MTVSVGQFPPMPVLPSCEDGTEAIPHISAIISVISHNNNINQHLSVKTKLLSLNNCILHIPNKYLQVHSDSFPMVST